MSLTILLGLFTSIIFFVLAKKRLSLAVLWLAFLLPLDNRIYFSWGFDQGSPARFALLGIFGCLFFSCIRAGVKLPKWKEPVFKDVFLQILVFVWVIRLISFSVSLDLASSISYQVFFSEVVLVYILLKKCVEEEGRVFILKFFTKYLMCSLVSSNIRSASEPASQSSSQ